jgi:hypothetical protein
MTEQELVIRKYEELYKLSKDGLDEELARFKRLDDKASIYFSVLSILLVISVFAGKFTLDLILPPTILLEWICFSLAMAFIGSLLMALLFVFSVLRTSYILTKIPVSHELITFFDEHTYLDVIDALTRGNVGAVEENRKVSDQKIQKLIWGYRLSLLSIFLIAIFTLAIVANFWISKL